MLLLSDALHRYYTHSYNSHVYFTFYYPHFVDGDITNKDTTKWQRKNFRADPLYPLPASMSMPFPIQHFQVVVSSFHLKTKSTLQNCLWQRFLNHAQKGEADVYTLNLLQYVSSLNNHVAWVHWPPATCRNKLVTGRNKTKPVNCLVPPIILKRAKS